jgi:isopentenyl diphosphate isomerase/L-lactate dehydrogenase-like FMN-dependent dehydrogenase
VEPATSRRWNLRPRVLVDVAACSTSRRVLGQEIAMPLLVAPVALQRMGHPDGELAMARAARAGHTSRALRSPRTS